MADMFTDKNPKYFYNSNEFPQLLFLQNHVSDIVTELNQVIQNNFDSNWLRTFPQYVTGMHPKAWKTFPFVFFGMRNPANENLCPFTASLIQQIPDVITAEFSFMEPHTHIQPHVGYSKMILRCHLPLIVPNESLCGIRVGDETQNWKTGKLMIFDDSFEHEAWNKSAQRRVLLMFDIPNPHWGYTAREICRWKIENLTDPFLLSLATKELWLSALNRGILPGQ